MIAVTSCITGLPSSLRGVLCFLNGDIGLKRKCSTLKTDENEIKLKITAILFNFVFLCLFGGLKLLKVESVSK